MGKSTRGSFTMRTSVISFGILLLVPAILADTFTRESVKVGKKTCTCNFEFTVAGNGKAKGTGSCDKKCSGNVKSMTLNSATYSYTFGFGVKKGKVKVGKVTAVEASTGGTTMPFGSGSGTATALPTGPGSGSGWTGMPTMPPGGSGSGWTGMPTMPPGGGYGYGDCAPGFLKVCPEMDGTCPYDSMAVCPAPMTMPFVRSLDRMMGQMGSSDGCECVPMVLMQMVMTQQEVMGRSLDRAGGDTFEDESVKVGKKTCTCDFTFTVAGNGKARGTGACDKKCSGNVKEMTLNGYEYSYTFGFSVKKGKVKVGKVTAVGGSTGGTTGMPGGSGMPGGGYGHSGCVCVHMPSDMGTGGSGMPPMPPTGTGSGSGPTGSPPTGGNGTGQLVLPALIALPALSVTLPPHETLDLDLCLAGSCTGQKLHGDVVKLINLTSTADWAIPPQMEILESNLCPEAEDPDQCKAILPDIWKAIALRLWPAYYSPEAEWFCPPLCTDPYGQSPTCDECREGLQAANDQLVDPRSIDHIVGRVLTSNICSTIPDDRCPEFLEVVLRRGIPILAESSNPEEFPQFCNYALPETCPT